MSRFSGEHGELFGAAISGEIGDTVERRFCRKRYLYWHKAVVT